MFSCDICEIFKSSYFEEHLQTTVPELNKPTSVVWTLSKFLSKLLTANIYWKHYFFLFYPGFYIYECSWSTFFSWKNGAKKQVGVESIKHEATEVLVGNQRFPVRIRLLAMCRGELSAVIARLISQCLWSEWKW